ncbi:hypothetical protein BG011_007270 [Mortierella polycephala]|uniref:Uncharacterized protein n=1 Tax=Mortierella polycephala TaxID=41804 RepID=A0A9P6TYY5_9FUNG|nr:hypothetical protein BG011_007270 [Mortierella polycephala]
METTTSRPPPATTTTRRPVTTTTRRPTTTPGRTTTTKRAPTTTTRGNTRTTTRRTSTLPSTSSTTSTSSPTSTIEAQPAGLSGGAIGGIVTGVLFLVAAAVGFLFYKRRRRGIAASKDSVGNSKEEPIYMESTNYGSKKESPNSDHDISGPLALGAEPGNGAAPLPFPLLNDNQHQQQYQHQQQKSATNKDHYGSPGAGSYGGLGEKSQLNDNHNHDRNLYQHSNGQDSKHYDGYNGNNHSHKHSIDDDRHPLKNDYYESNGYYRNLSDPIGAQRPPTRPQDTTQGNLTPAPDYYLGKEDIDPMRDIRGMDLPENYIRDQKLPLPISPDRNPQGTSSAKNHASLSSDAGSEYQTLEQAQKAHQQKMMGHKESIGSVQVLIDKSSKDSQYQQDQRYDQLRSPETPSFSHQHASMTISDSTMSMVPSLPPTSSPMPYNPSESSSPYMNGHSRQGSDLRMHGGKYPPNGHGGRHDDPYGESAYGDGNSQHHGPYRGGPPHYNGPTPPGQSYSSRDQHGPYGGGGYQNNGYGPGPGYATSPPYSGYDRGRPQQPMRGGGGGYGPSPGQGWQNPGYGSPGPGRGAPDFPPQNGGYMPHPQRDPGYNQSPYAGAY